MTDERRAELRRRIGLENLTGTPVSLSAAELAALLDAADRVAALEAEVKRLQSMTEHDMLKAWLNRMQEKQAHIQHPDGNTWCEWKCTACGKRIMWSNGDTNDLTGVDIDCVKCCHCGTVHDLRDDYEIRLRPEYRKDDAEETHPCIATLEAELAALKGVNQ